MNAAELAAFFSFDSLSGYLYIEFGIYFAGRRKCGHSVQIAINSDRHFLGGE